MNEIILVLNLAVRWVKLCAILNLIDSRECHSCHIRLCMNAGKKFWYRRSKEFDYKNIWSSWIQCNMSPTMVAKGLNCNFFAWALALLLICWSNLNSQKDVDIMQQLRRKLAYWKHPESVQRSRVSLYSLKTLLCIFWYSYDVLHSLCKVHKLTKAAKNYCSHYDKTSENFGSLRLHTAYQRKKTFLNAIFTLVTTHHKVPT